MNLDGGAGIRTIGGIDSAGALPLDPPRNAKLLGERRLWSAVMERALEDIQGRSERWREDAQGWFLSRIEHPWPFEWVCRQLGIDADAVRAELRRRKLL